MIVQANKLDSDGFIIEPVIVSFSDVLQVDVVKDIVPDGLYTPRWNYSSKTWIEGATQEVILQIKADQLEAENSSGDVITKLLTENKQLRESTDMQAMALMELAELLLG